MLKIENLVLCERLERAQMKAVRGGFDPFAYLGLTSMLHEIPGHEPAPGLLKPAGEAMSPQGETIVVEDTNHTEITTTYP